MQCATRGKPLRLDFNENSIILHLKGTCQSVYHRQMIIKLEYHSLGIFLRVFYLGRISARNICDRLSGRITKIKHELDGKKREAETGDEILFIRSGG